MNNGMDVAEAQKLVGQYRRFGEYGPVYHVVRVKNDGEVVEIEITESGATADVLAEFVVKDPLL